MILLNSGYRTHDELIAKVRAVAQSATSAKIKGIQATFQKVASLLTALYFPLDIFFVSCFLHILRIRYRHHAAIAPSSYIYARLLIYKCVQLLEELDSGSESDADHEPPRPPVKRLVTATPPPATTKR